MDERSAYQQIIGSPNFSRTKQGDQRWYEVLYRGQTWKLEVAFWGESA